jgi:hypothetical protein
MECYESASDYKEESSDSIDVLMQESTNSDYKEANSCGENATPVTEGTETGCALMTDAELGMKIKKLKGVMLILLFLTCPSFFDETIQ